jgi:hypothetical protein
MSTGFTMLGAEDAAACEGDACLIPTATPPGEPVAAGSDPAHR